MTAHNPITLPPQAFERLLALLEQETHLLAQVEAQMQAKKDCLIANNTAGLMQADQALMGLGQKTAQIEQQRMDLMSRMGFADQTLEQMVGTLQADYPEQGRQLQQTRQGMRRLLERIQTLNRNNQELLSLSIQWIDRGG